MRSVTGRYPVDRYMVESSKTFEMVNITDDDLWNSEPALKPEDEIILRKLHEMLQSTSDDLKLLSGELSKFHEPGVQVKIMPTPLDEEFNEKVHIEEIVNAKFHGHKIIDPPTSRVPEYKPSRDDVRPTLKTNKPKLNNTYVQANPASILKKPIKRNLVITHPKVIQINGNENSTKTEKLNNGKVINAPAVRYNEYSFKYVEPKFSTPLKNLKVQEMPSINIRGELKEQKVLQLDIIPENTETVKSNTISKNVAVIALQHEMPKPLPTTTITTESYKFNEHPETTKSKVRLVSKMSTYDSSGSTNNVSSDTHVKVKTQKRLLINTRSPKNSARYDRKKTNSKKETNKRSHLNLDEWRNKLNAVYGPARSSNIKINKQSKPKSKAKLSPKKTNLLQNKSPKLGTLNNAEYIPYSKLTIGGVRVSDIEKEISEIPNKNNIPLSPIIDRILSSRENSFSQHSPRKSKIINNQKILSTSDENLLQEVIDIERTVSETLSKNLKTAVVDPKPQKISSETDEANENVSYIDDFEEDKSNHSEQSANEETYNKHSNDSKKTSEDENEFSSENEDHFIEKEVKLEASSSKANIHNKTYTKTSKLAFKNQIDIFEFVHAVDTQDSATQSNGQEKIVPNETQTTPRSDRNVQPIHNDLWPSIDPNGRVEKMFEIEKEFIKKLIIEEYGDLLEKNITKPSTSKEVEDKRNVAASQKNTQTSPAHVKIVMTSPTQTKTRTTSPFTGLTVDHHTSPFIFITNDDNVNINIEDEEDLASSINLSSPRFSLRLPGTSREVINNMGDSTRRTEKKISAEANKSSTYTRKSSTKTKKSSADNRKKNIENRKSFTEAKKSTVEAGGSSIAKKINLYITSTSTSTVEADSSDVSSLGEVKLRRLLGKALISSDSDSGSSISSKYSSDLQSGILPLRSEGEMSLGLNTKPKRYNYSKSEGEASNCML